MLMLGCCFLGGVVDFCYFSLVFCFTFLVISLVFFNSLFCFVVVVVFYCWAFVGYCWVHRWIFACLFVWFGCCFNSPNTNRISGDKTDYLTDLNQFMPKQKLWKR